MQEYKELSDKISEVQVTMTEKIGEVLASVRELGATMKGAMDQMRDMRKDVDEAKNVGTLALKSTESAHKRLDTQEKALKPLAEANLVERVKSIESNIRWAATLIIGAVALAVLGLVLVKGGG